MVLFFALEDTAKAGTQNESLSIFLMASQIDDIANVDFEVSVWQIYPCKT